MFRFADKLATRSPNPPQIPEVSDHLQTIFRHLQNRVVLNSGLVPDLIGTDPDPGIQIHPKPDHTL
jgi:hypothetical protein